MKRFLILVLLVLAATTLVSAQATKKGPIVDKVYYDVRMQDEIGLQDAAEGKTDIFMYGVQGSVYKALPQPTKDKLDVYDSPSGLNSLEVNPYPNAAPYYATIDGKDLFNPFAIQEARFAVNFLVNRKYILDEIYGGAGSPDFTPATTGQPGTYKYNLVASKLGLTTTGNEKKGIDDMNAALAKASELAALKGRLVKGAQWWMFDGNPVTVKFYIRSDDPNGRLKWGRYIADQIEKAGIKVERMELNRAGCFAQWQNADPAKLTWGLYTGGWGAGGTNKFWEVNITQWFSPYVGSLPGGGKEGFWSYTNEETDALGQKVMTGQFKDEADYWDSILKVTDIGLRDSIRITLCTTSQIYVANKARFISRMDYGLGDGISNGFALLTADVKPDKDGTKILRIAQRASQGALFLSAWDPVGTDGMGDSYTLYVSKPCSDEATFQSPTSADVTPWRATWKDLQTKSTMGKDDKGQPVVQGQIAVPATAIKFNPTSQKWEPVGASVTSISKATYTFKFGKWHDGTPMRVADLMYAFGFEWTWSTKKGDGDKYYDEGYANVWAPGLEKVKGIVVNPDNTITVYFDYQNPMDKGAVAAFGAPNWRVSAAGQPNDVEWTVLEALSDMVAEGSFSKTAWSFSSDPSLVEVDLLNPKCLTDIKAALNLFILAQHVPASMAKWITADQAVQAYQNTIDFINAHKNAFVSNGAFYINMVDLDAMFVELAANRDPSYPFAAGYWNKFFATTTTRIDNVQPPAMATKGKDAKITVKVSAVAYPANTAKAADATAKVTLILVTPAGDKTYTGAFVKAGEFAITVPAAATKDLKAGSYAMVVQSQLKSEAPSVQSANLVLF